MFNIRYFTNSCSIVVLLWKSATISIFLSVLGFIFLVPVLVEAHPKDFTILIEGPDDRAPLANRTPLILIHGIHGNQWPTGEDDVNNPFLRYWRTFRMFFSSWDKSGLKDKYKLYSFWYESDQISVDEISQGLRDWIDERTFQEPGTPDKLDEKPFVIVAHSMGGLVARAFMNQTLNVGQWAGRPGGERVIKLVTLGTPHHGTHGANGAYYAGVLCNGCLCEEAKPNWRSLLCLIGEVFYWNQTVSEPNRNDLLWDNFNGSMNECNEDNGLLPLTSEFDDKIIAYGGILPANDPDRPNPVSPAAPHRRRVSL